MRNWLITAVVVSMAAAVIPTAAVAAQTDARKALQANYNDRDNAVSHKDIDGTLAHYAPDFTGVSTTGKTHDLKEERADFLKTFSLPAKSSVTKSTIQKVTWGKAGAEATVSVHRHGLLLFVNPQTQFNDILALDGIYQDTWTKRGGVWLLTREQVNSLKATMNGKPL